MILKRNNIVEATSELFLQKHSSYSFSRNILHYTMLEYCLFLTCFLPYTTDFPSQEDPKSD